MWSSTGQFWEAGSEGVLGWVGLACVDDLEMFGSFGGKRVAMFCIYDTIRDLRNSARGHVEERHGYQDIPSSIRGNIG